MKKLLAVMAWVIAFLLASISSTYADLYTVTGATTTALGWASKDIADSLVWTVGSLLPVFIPLIVVWFVIAFIRGFISKRG